MALAGVEHSTQTFEATRQLNLQKNEQKNYKYQKSLIFDSMFFLLLCLEIVFVFCRQTSTNAALE